MELLLQQNAQMLALQSAQGTQAVGTTGCSSQQCL
jgi:hypothetical protein